MFQQTLDFAWKPLEIVKQIGVLTWIVGTLWAVQDQSLSFVPDGSGFPCYGGVPLQTLN